MKENHPQICDRYALPEDENDDSCQSCKELAELDESRNEVYFYVCNNKDCINFDPEYYDIK